MSATVCVCVKQFRARLDDELSLQVGDKIEILADDSEYNDGWFTGKNVVSNEVGLFPKSFTHTLVPETDPPTPHASSRTPQSPAAATFSPADTAASPLANTSVASAHAMPSTPMPAPNKFSASSYSTPSSQPHTPAHITSMPAAPLDVAAKAPDSPTPPVAQIDRALGELRIDAANPLSATSPEMHPSNVLQWTPAQVSSYFAMVLGFDIDVAGKFSRHKITGAILFELDLALLKELDIDSFGTRFEIHREIKKLREQLLLTTATTVPAGQSPSTEAVGPLHPPNVDSTKSQDHDIMGKSNHPDQIGNQNGNQKGNQKGNQNVNQKGNQRGNQNGNQRGNQRGNQNVNQNVNQRGNQNVNQDANTIHQDQNINQNANTILQDHNGKSNHPDHNGKSNHPDHNGKSNHPDHNGKSNHPDHNGKPHHQDHNGKPNHPDHNIIGKPHHQDHNETPRKPHPHHSRQNSHAGSDLPDPHIGSGPRRQLLGKSVAPSSPTFFTGPAHKRFSGSFHATDKAMASHPDSAVVPLLPGEKHGAAPASPSSYAKLQRSPSPQYASTNTAFRFGAGLAQKVPRLALDADSTPHMSPYLRHSRNYSESLSVVIRLSPSADPLGHGRRPSSASDTHKRTLSALARSRPLSLFYLPSANGEKSPLKSSGIGKRLSQMFSRNSSEVDFSADPPAPEPAAATPILDQMSLSKSPLAKPSFSADLFDSSITDPLLGSPKKFQSVLYPATDAKALLDERRVNSDAPPGSPLAQNPALRLKSLRTTSTQNFKNLTASKKAKTSAFQEGINTITPTESSKTANFAGWMAKKSGNNLSWRLRYFTLHGTRLLYYASLKDTKEKGLIDITAHRVLPVNVDNEAAILGSDKMIAMYAASAGFGRYCFKIIPPAPGFKKGLTFTQPRMHYFAVDTAEEMRGWMKAIKAATIDMDDDAPKVSSCTTPTISLGKAQEMLAKAREATRQRDEQLASGGCFDHDDRTDDTECSPRAVAAVLLDPNSAESLTSDVTEVRQRTPRLEIHIPDRSVSHFADTSPGVPSPGGFASPYLLASGLLSPRLPSSATDPVGGKFDGAASPKSPAVPVPDAPPTATTPKASKVSLAGVFAKRSSSRAKPEPMVAYLSDGAKNTITPRS